MMPSQGRVTFFFVAVMALLPAAWAAPGPTHGVREGEYFFSPRDGQIQAPNRAQELRTRIDGRGIEVVPRGELAAKTPSVRLSLDRLIRGQREVEVESGIVTHDEGRAEIRRRDVTEWFVNDEAGLEHGLDIPVPPLAGGEPLVLRYRLGGDVLAEPAGPDGVWFRTTDGEPWLTYRDLVVWDATGIEIPATMRLAAGVLDIVIDDAEAVYPLTVDPLLSNAVWSVEAQQSSAYVGAASSTAGDVNGDGYSDILVAAYGYDGGQTNEGRVWLYYGSPSGPTGSPVVLESNQAGAQFGFSIGAAGDVNDDGYDDFLVGANLYDSTQVNAGAVYLYHGGSSGPSLKRIIEGVQAGAELGRSVATAGDVNNDGYADIVVTAHAYDAGQTNEGRAYVHHGGPSTVSATPDWFAEGNQAEARFGTAAMTAGDVNGDGYSDVIVGAYLYDDGQIDEGAAFVFLGGSSGLADSAVWTHDGNWPGGRFGFAVATAGDVNADGYSDVVVGAYLTDFSLNNEGAAFVFLGGASGPSNSRHVSWYGEQAHANLGRSVFTAGDVNGDGYADVAVGANGYDNPSGGQGRVHVYHGSSAGLPLQPDWIKEEGSSASEYGKSVATAGDVNGDGYSDLLAGDPTYDNGQTNEGKLRLYLGSPGGLSYERATWQGAAAGDDLGRAVAHAGDVNGDGFSDVIVSAPGVAQLRAHYGNASGLPSSPSWIATTPPDPSFQFGTSLASAGDVDGDGYDDVLVGDPLYTGDVYREGRVALYLGSSSGLQSSAHRLLVGNDDQVHFGRSVASAGDVNGDGYADIIIGAPDYFFTDGAAFIYHGSPTGPDSSAATTTIQGNNDHLGVAVASAGDVDGDGYSDVIVCGSGDRRAWVYPGSPAGVQTGSRWTLTPDSGIGAQCDSVTSVGDINGDGYADVAYGDHLWNTAYVFFGSSAGPSPTPDAMRTGGFDEAFGTVASAGDVNNDGYSDLLVGSGLWDGSGTNAGRARLYLGSASGLAASVAWSEIGETPYDFFGQSLDTAGDVNGDGCTDVVVGERGWDGTGLDHGRFHLYLGCGGDGMDRIPRQQRPGSTSAAPVAFLGRSTGLSSFRLRSRARSAAGRIRMQVEYEVRPWTLPFQGSGTHFSNELMSSPPASDGTRINYSSPIGGLTTDTRYKWRLRHRSSSPYFPHTQWQYQQGNGLEEWSIRTGCTASLWYRDADGDGYGDPSVPLSTCDDSPSGYVADAGDCSDGNANAWNVPGETLDLQLSSDGATTSFAWSAPADPGASPGTWHYDLIRSVVADDFVNGTHAECAASNLPTESASDSMNPPAGDVLFYLTRAENFCGGGNLGADSDGSERAGRNCP